MPSWIGVELFVNPDKCRFRETSRDCPNLMSVIGPEKMDYQTRQDPDGTIVGQLTFVINREICRSGALLQAYDT